MCSHRRLRNVRPQWLDTLRSRQLEIGFMVGTPLIVVAGQPRSIVTSRTSRAHVSIPLDLHSARVKLGAMYRQDHDAADEQVKLSTPVADVSTPPLGPKYVGRWKRSCVWGPNPGLRDDSLDLIEQD